MVGAPPFNLEIQRQCINSMGGGAIDGEGRKNAHSLLKYLDAVMLKCTYSLQNFPRAIIGATVIGASPDFYPASTFATFFGGLGVRSSLNIFQILTSFSFPSVTTY